MQSIFDTTSLNLNQWLVCIGAASSILWIEEIRKLVRRAMKKKALSTNER
jgi:hypothetical protein